MCRGRAKARCPVCGVKTAQKNVGIAATCARTRRIDQLLRKLLRSRDAVVATAAETLCRNALGLAELDQVGQRSTS